MVRRFSRESDGVDEMIASIDPVARESLRTREIERAQDDIAAAIMTVPQRSARARRRRWLARPRHAIVIGALVAGLGGGIAAAASFLSAHTGYYPTKHGIPITMGGPGEDLNPNAPDFCRVALQATSDIPFPARYASWHEWVIGFDFQIKHVSSSVPCAGAPTGAHVTSGWLGQWVAASAFCGWAQAWAHDVGSRDRAGSAQDARAISDALDWRAVKLADPHPDDAPAGDAPGGDGTKTPLGWMLSYQQAVRSGDRTRVERLLTGADGFGECVDFDPDLSNWLLHHDVRSGKAKVTTDLLAHLRSEGI
jgi:hypothetical protein